MRTGPLHFLLGWLLATLFWLLLTASFSALGAGLSALLGLAVTVLARAHLGLLTGLRLRPQALLSWLQFTGRLLLMLVRSALTSPLWIFRPRIARAGLSMELNTALQSRLGRLLLAYALSLTPNLLVVALSGGRLTVHVLPSGRPPLASPQTAQAQLLAWERLLQGAVR